MGELLTAFEFKNLIACIQNPMDRRLGLINSEPQDVPHHKNLKNNEKTISKDFQKRRFTKS